MKVLIGLLFLTTLILQDSQAQSKSANNISNQPVWGPIGYELARFYYLPEIDMYYDVQQRNYIYQENKQWVYINHLPNRFRNYDLFKGYKVVLNSDNPFQKNASHISKYKPYKNNHQQTAIIYSNDEKYFVIKGHPRNKDTNGNNRNNGAKKNKKN